jgi:Putative Flp pilus-assembly TadE/G-like
MNRLRKKSKGQFIVVWTIAIVALLGAIALCTDIAIIYYNYVKLQKAADSAALAGANYLETFSPALAVPSLAPGCSGGEDWWNVACTYTVLNGAQTPEATIVSPAPDAPAGLPANTKTIEVTLIRNDIPAYFARALGRTAPYTVKVSAVAAISAVGMVTNPLPIGLQPNNENGGGWVSGDPVTLYENNVAGAGNWEWLNIPPGCSGTSCDVPNGSYVPGEITGGCDGCSLSAGDNLYTQPGEAWGPISSALGTLLENGPVNVIVPIIDWTGTTNGSSSSVTITGFAEIQLTEFGKSGNSVYLTGTFLQTIPPGGESAGSNSYPYPPYFVWLAK